MNKQKRSDCIAKQYKIIKKLVYTMRRLTTYSKSITSQNRLNGLLYYFIFTINIQIITKENIRYSNSIRLNTAPLLFLLYYYYFLLFL